MENGKRIAAEDGEILLPEPIIQHIQSFLNGRQSAQTSILSKSWYSAWSTRPNLDFDQRDFPRQGDGDPEIADEFAEFARRTMQRYQDLNLRVESFCLWMRVDEDNMSLARELILKAVQMGPIDLNLDFVIQTVQFVLPLEMLASENLIRLSVTGCTIIHGMNQEVMCPKLKSFSLSRVYIRSDTIRDIISSCPLIETFSLSECECLFKFNRCIAGVFNDNRRSAFLIDLGKQNVGSCDGVPINPHEFHKLKCLFLRRVNIDTFFFRDFSSRFPCLKDLTLWDCIGYKNIRFSSSSLECISIVQNGRMMGKFNVPNIQKFKLSGSCLPSLSFKTASREWESDISLRYTYPTNTWFLKLKKFLKKLSLSKISLSIGFGVPQVNSFDNGDTQGLSRTVVENLTLWTFEPLSDCSAFLNALFLSCRPNFITEYWPHNPHMKKLAEDFLDVLCKTLIQEVTEDCCVPNRNMSGLHDLEEVNVEIFQESVAEWRLLPLKTLSDASAFSEIKQKIRFRLRWGLQPITSN